MSTVAGLSQKLAPERGAIFLIICLDNSKSRAMEVGANFAVARNQSPKNCLVPAFMAKNQQPTLFLFQLHGKGWVNTLVNFRLAVAATTLR